MTAFPPTIILRHRRENKKKCSLRGLETRDDLRFYQYPNPQLPPLAGYLLLTINAPSLTEADAHYGLLLLDGTWRYTAKMYAATTGLAVLPKRSLPSALRTAYPRRQDDCPNPNQGLASVEALYAAYSILHRSTTALLDNYYWRDHFLQQFQL